MPHCGKGASKNPIEQPDRCSSTCNRMHTQMSRQVCHGGSSGVGGEAMNFPTASLDIVRLGCFGWDVSFGINPSMFFAWERDLESAGMRSRVLDLSPKTFAGLFGQFRRFLCEPLTQIIQMRKRHL